VRKEKSRGLEAGQSAFSLVGNYLGQVHMPTQDYQAHLHIRSLQWSLQSAASKRLRSACDMPFVRLDAKLRTRQEYWN